MNELKHKNPGKQVEPATEFQDLLAELSARFINSTAEEMDEAIEEAQHLLCEKLTLDRSALFQVREEDPAKFLLTHQYLSQDAGRLAAEKRVASHLASRCCNSRPYSEISFSDFFPWTYRQLRDRQTVIIADVEALPTEAALDQESLRSSGTRLAVMLPLYIGGNLAGSLTFESSREQKQRLSDLVKHFEFVARVFTSALTRNRVEKALRESEQRCRALVDQAGDGIELLDETGRYLDVNAASLRQLGYTRQEMLGLSLFEVEPSINREQFAQRSTSLRNNKMVRAETVHRRKDGSTFPVEVTTSSIQINGEGFLLNLVRDITDRKLAEEELARSYREIEQLKVRLEAESKYLKAEIRVSHAHGQIIGRSPGIKRVLHQVEQVAPAECVVLVSGETGTGKELIAQEIHRLSRRHERLMVLVNCAALPSALVESELFGRERGAYTGALTTQVGRFEMAHGSTIFLDEVGELSMEMQAKLLRVLQQGEFQRLGNPKTHKVDVRVIAATNRDLAEEVRKGSFREDLYYRLKVFPVEIPPLRERVEDISPLVFAFLEEFSTRMGKKITKVPRSAMERLEAHSWPGNIRELRNVIEHSVILSSGDVLKLSNLSDPPMRDTHAVTLAEAEREHIVKTLESTGWRIKGSHGAARRLALEPSTLYSRMQKLGIPNRRQKDEMSTEAVTGFSAGKRMSIKEVRVTTGRDQRDQSSSL
jgi:PAS domain S-box-containing protein